MSEELCIQARSGPYRVEFLEADIEGWLASLPEDCVFLVDKKVAALHEGALRRPLASSRVLLIDATEPAKSLEEVVPIVERLLELGVRRGQLLVAVGGGIIQDICCFVASTLFRGLPWSFVPTTLLAQADSCIGSKSSINLGKYKNIVGTFYPPEQVLVFSGFLDTLPLVEWHSGAGEMLKVHAISGPSAFDSIASDFHRLFSDPLVLRRYVRASLAIKQSFVEADEFDRGIRNLLNFGHSFGHAIESATAYAMPHGVAVTIGMEMAAFVANRRGLLPEEQLLRMRDTLRENYAIMRHCPIPVPGFFEAIRRDKKNTVAALGLILPVGPNASVERVAVPMDEQFRDACGEYLSEWQG